MRDRENARRALQAATYCAALLGAAFFGAAAQAADPGAGKIDNLLSRRPLAADEGAFLRAAQQTPASGSCDALSPDPDYVEEMLARFDASGTKTYELRVAFVVGNGAYKNISALANPPNDAASMAKMFRALGFTVYRAVDVTEAGLNACFARFREHLERIEAAGEKAAVSLFFYAGHGVQLTPEGKAPTNYMLSIDAKVDAGGKAIGFKQIDPVLNEMRAHSEQALFLYDACRNAPFGAGAVKQADGNAVRVFDASGAAEIQASPSATATQAGLFIAYATSPGMTADDAWGPQGSAHSPFTQALLNNLATPGIVVDEAMVKARSDVGALTDRKQTPWTSSSKTESVFLNGALSKKELRDRVGTFASRAEEWSAQGARGKAIAEAMKGLPPDWAKAAPEHIAALRALSLAEADPRVRFEGHSRDVEIAVVSPGGEILATAADGDIGLWNIGTGALLRSFAHLPVAERQELRFSKDGRRLATSSRETTMIWDVASGALKTKVAGNVAAFSADGATIATASGVAGDKAVRIFDASSGSARSTIATVGDEIRDVAYSPNGRFLAALSADRVEVFDAANGAPVWMNGLPIGEPNADLNEQVGRRARQTKILWSADSRRLWSVGDALAIWEDGGQIHLSWFNAFASGDPQPVRTMALSRDGSRVSVAAGLYDIDGRNFEGRVLRAGLPGPLIGVGFSAADEPLLVGKAGKDARIVDWRLVGFEDARSPAAGGRVGFADVDIDRAGARYATASPDDVSGASLWSAEGLLIRKLTADGVAATAVKFSPEGERVAVALEGGSVAIFDSDSGANVVSLGAAGEPLYALAWSRDGKRLATADESGILRVYNAAGGAPLWSGTGEKYPWRIRFSGDGKLAMLGGEGASISIWNAATGAPLSPIGDGPVISDFAFLGDELAIAANDAVAIGSRTLPESRGDIDRLEESSDGRLFARRKGVAVAFDLATGDKLGEYRPMAQEASGFALGGGRVVTAQGAAVYAPPIGRYGPALMRRANDLLTDDLRAEVDRERIRYWEIDPKLLQ